MCIKSTQSSPSSPSSIPIKLTWSRRSRSWTAWWSRWSCPSSPTRSRPGGAVGRSLPVNHHHYHQLHLHHQPHQQPNFTKGVSDWLVILLCSATLNLQIVFNILLTVKDVPRGDAWENADGGREGGQEGPRLSEAPYHHDEHCGLHHHILDNACLGNHQKMGGSSSWSSSQDLNRSPVSTIWSWWWLWWWWWCRCCNCDQIQKCGLCHIE